MQQMDARQPWQPYTVHTRNFAVNSENRIHEDATAREYGFPAGLVSGVTVYSHLTHPLMERYGEDWAAGGLVDVSFTKPAYDGERVTVVPEWDADGAVAVTAYNPTDEVLARMTWRPMRALPAVDPHAAWPPAAAQAERPAGTWEAIVPEQPFQALHWRPSLEDNIFWSDNSNDDLTLYRREGGPVNPGLVLQQANNVFAAQFRLEPWIHTGSHIVMRRGLYVGQAVEVRAVPLERWERKGHLFARLYVSMRVDGEMAQEVYHTAIFKVHRPGT